MVIGVVCGIGLIGKGLVDSGFLKLSSKSNEIMGRSTQYSDDQRMLVRAELFRINPTIFINAAGPSSVSDSISDHKSYVEFPWQQCLAQLKVLNELPDPPTYLFISSGSVYGNTPILGASETHSLNPVSPYAQGKLLAENSIQDFSHVYRGNIIIARCFSVYDYNLRTRLPYLISQKMQESQSFSLFGTGSEKRDYIHVSDVVEAFQKIITQNYKFGIFNIGTGIPITVRELCEMASNVFEQKFHPKIAVNFNGETRVFDPENLIADIATLREIGFTPKIEPNIGLLRYFKSIKEK